MSLTSLHFLWFVLVGLGVYYGLPRRLQNYWLLLLSYVFCITWAWQFALTLGVVTIANYVLARRLSVDAGHRRAFLWSGLALNVATLVLFRTANWFLPGMLALLDGLGVSTRAGGMQILVPLGLSYYVLQNISYLIDVHRRQTRASTDLVDFALYLAYFPKLVAGPIERARSFLPALARPRVVDNAVLARSATLILIGLVRKLLVADPLASAILSDVYDVPARYTPPELIGWLLLYSFSLYNDFAGYTSIVRGVSGLFGIELSQNFQHPYFARNFTEFWNRWHITLSHWLRDYIYYPLSRMLLRRNPSARGLLNLVAPPMVTMLVSGLWHGFSWHMLMWGGLHGTYQAVGRLRSLWRPLVPPQEQPWWRQCAAMSFVFTLVVLAWVPFRWGLPEAFEFWGALLNWSDVAIHHRRLVFACPVLVIALGLDWLQYWHQDEVPFAGWPRAARAALLAASLFLILIASQADHGEPFVYQGF